MAWTLLTPVATNGPNPTAFVEVVFTPATPDAGDDDGNEYTLTGREVLLVRNAHATDAKVVNLFAVQDSRNNRPADASVAFVTKSIDAGDIWMIKPEDAQAWKSVADTVRVVGATDDIEFCVLDVTTWKGRTS